MTRFSRLLAYALAVVASAETVSAQPPPSRQPELEAVKKFENFGLIGIAVSQENRIFASAPAARDGDKVIEVDARSGAIRAFPSEDWQKAGPGGRDPWFAPQALFVDSANDLWVLDSGRSTLPTTAPTGAPKLVRFDLSTDRVRRIYRFDGVVAEDDSLNDVRIDLRRNRAYIANIGRQGSLVILDLDTGQSRQVLVGDRSTRADPGHRFKLGDEPAIPPGGVPMVVHVDGLTLSPDGDWLYYRTLTDRNYWRIRTDALADDRLSEKALADRVEFLGEGPVTGGIVMDDAGTLYGGDLENGPVVALTLDPSSNRLTSKTFVEAPGTLVWADGFAIANGYLYIADSRLSESVFVNHLPKRGIPTIFRVRLPETIERPSP